jgi:vancomycin resistance protein VanJ
LKPLWQSTASGKGEGERVDMTTETHQKAPAWLLTLLFSYGALLAALAVLNRLGPDRWWFGDFNLYLPQVVWLVPGIPLAFICLKVARRWTLLPLCCMVWVLGPLMGFCWPAYREPAPVPGVALRVMTWNVHHGEHDRLAGLALIHDIDGNQPDVVFIQATGNLLKGPLGEYFRNWNIQSQGEHVIASRIPLVKVAEPAIAVSGKNVDCLRCRVRLGSSLTTLYSVHFESPRVGLGSLMASRKNLSSVSESIEMLGRNVATRFNQSLLVSELVSREKGPVIVAGDFNSTDASVACANLRDVGLHDAFAEGGRGYGYTYGHFIRHELRYSWMRIDHIMMSAQLRARRSWTGTWEASDHRPVIADLVLGQN